jgi:glycosyltransferase involved in cell wall biosynthesis
MTTSKTPLLSVVVPLYNENAGLAHFHESLLAILRQIDDFDYEIVYCDDGSTDNTADIVRRFHEENHRVRLISLSRNFGKEIATTAGMVQARGDVVMTIDADGQHPVELVPDFLERWRVGSKVVIGVRTANQKEGMVKRLGSKLFYATYNRFVSVKMVPGSTDYRLLDRTVCAQFARMTERNRISRGLIDWLGYKRDFIYYKANPRVHGEAGYSFKKLMKLFVDSIVSLSISPLYLVAYIGAVVLPVSILVGLVMFVNFIFGDPLGLNATASSYVIVFMLFLIGVLLVSQGIIGMYLSHIHTETQNRPLYIVDDEKSIGIHD